MSVTLPEQEQKRLKRRYLVGRLFAWLCLAATFFGLAILVVLVAGLIIQSWGYLSWEFVTSDDPEVESIFTGIWGSFWLMVLTAIFAIPIGIATAIMLEEFSSRNWFTRVVQLNITNLAGVPSIVYGLLGVTVFVNFFGVYGTDPQEAVLNLGFGKMVIPLPFGERVISGALTLALLILPIIIVATQEALRAVPPSIRHASLALGATRWQTIRRQVLPVAIPGIATGVILALSRAVGETAPLVMVGAANAYSGTPGGITSVTDFFTSPGGIVDAPFSRYTAMPMQIYAWTKEAEQSYQHIAAAGIIVLLCFLFLMNGIAIYIRNKTQKRLS